MFCGLANSQGGESLAVCVCVCVCVRACVWYVVCRHRGGHMRVRVVGFKENTDAESSVPPSTPVPCDAAPCHTPPLCMPAGLFSVPTALPRGIAAVAHSTCSRDYARTDTSLAYTHGDETPNRPTFFFLNSQWDQVARTDLRRLRRRRPLPGVKYNPPAPIMQAALHHPNKPVAVFYC